MSVEYCVFRRDDGFANGYCFLMPPRGAPPAVADDSDDGNDGDDADGDVVLESEDCRICSRI